MTTWTPGQLNRIAEADELEIATPKDDGSLRQQVPIWVVRHGDALYVRSFRGKDSTWHRGAMAHDHGHISAGGVDAEVTFEHIADEEVNTEIDAAYRSKYGRYGPRFLDPMVAPAARETTLKLVPQFPT